MISLPHRSRLRFAVGVAFGIAAVTEQSAAEEVAMAPTQARRESEGGAAIPPARPAPVSPEDRPAYLTQGGASTTLGVQLAVLGRQVSRRMVPSNHASRIEPMKKIARSLRQHRE